MELVTGNAVFITGRFVHCAGNLSASKLMWHEHGHDSSLQDFEPPGCGLADSLFRILDETVVKLTHIKHYGS
jgi:hypothetical protein